MVLFCLKVCKSGNPSIYTGSHDWKKLFFWKFQITDAVFPKKDRRFVLKDKMKSHKHNYPLFPFCFYPLNTCVMNLSQIELVSSLAAHMMLCCAFAAKTMLVTHQFFGCFWTVLAMCEVFLFFSPLSKAGWGWSEHSWDIWSKLTKGIFYAIWHHAHPKKLKERRRKKGHLWLCHLS